MRESRSYDSDLQVYGIYGLTLRSALPLPELATKAGGPDVFIGLRSAESLRAAPAVQSRARVTADEAELIHDGVGRFLVRGGREIIVTPAPGVEDRTLRLYLLGPALAVLLHQRGRLVLHASAVAVNGQAVAFLGGSGWGKSTVAAALHRQGHAILADDVVAVGVREGDVPLVYPGAPQLKLWPDVIRALGGRPEKLVPLGPKLAKRAYPVDHDGLIRPVELKRLYVLAEGSEPKIEPLGGSEAAVELIRHTYGVRLVSGINPKKHLLQCAALAACVPIRRLRRPRELRALPALARCVEEDMACASVDQQYRRAR